MIKTGDRVMTCMGAGTAVGEESFYGGKLSRTLVRLDDPSGWSLGLVTDIAAFFPGEITLDDACPTPMGDFPISKSECQKNNECRCIKG